jgi:Tfp pilus assembly protein PilN
MIEINLLRDTASHQSKSVNTDWVNLSGLISTLLLTTGMGYWYWILAMQENELAPRHSCLLEASFQLNELRKRLDTLQDESDQLEQTWSSLRRLECNRKTPVLLMNTVVVSVPIEGTLWLTELRHEKQKLRITGQALGVRDITTFIKHLSETDNFRQVELHHWKEEAETFRFEVLCLPRT